MRFPDLEAKSVNHTKEKMLILTLDGQQEADLPGQLRGLLLSC